jgi:hypothetical protein
MIEGGAGAFNLFQDMLGTQLESGRLSTDFVDFGRRAVENLRLSFGKICVYNPEVSWTPS